MPTNWRVYGSETVAAVLDKAELPGFWRQVTVGPNECALIIRDGKIQETVTQERVGTSGFLDRIAGLFGRAGDVQVIFVDTTPFDLSFYLGDLPRDEGSIRQRSSGSSGSGSSSNFAVAASRDDVYDALQTRYQADTDTSQVVIQTLSIDSQPITAEVRITVSVEMEDVNLLTGLLRNKAALATWDLSALIRDELIAKVLVPKVAQHRADELRGNVQLSNEINQAVEGGLKTTFGLWGLTLENFFINWGLTEQEVQEIGEARGRREEQATEFVHQRTVRDMERKVDLDRTRIVNLRELTNLEAQGEEGLNEIYLAAELDRDNMVDGQRVNVAQVDAKLRTLELDVQQQEANLLLETERAQADLRLDVQRKQSQAQQEELEAESRREMNEMEQLVNLQSRRQNDKHMRELETLQVNQRSEFDRRRQELENEFAIRRVRQDETKDRMGSRERLLSEGLKTGAVTPEVLRAMLEQETEQVYADSSEAIVDSRSRAQAASSNVESLREEQDRERSHQAEMTRLSSEMMEASKQTPAPTPPAAAQPPAYGSTVNLTSITAAQPTAPPPDATQPISGGCPSCSTPVLPGWKACPQCGTSLEARQNCPSCGSGVESAWKACPSCGTSLIMASKCPDCTKDIEPQWKACPYCGTRLGGSS